MMDRRNEYGVAELAELAFGMQPAEELYYFKFHPGQLAN
jgi:hypothetical protein